MERWRSRLCNGIVALAGAVILSGVTSAAVQGWINSVADVSKITDEIELLFTAQALLFAAVQILGVWWVTTANPHQTAATTRGLRIGLLLSVVVPLAAGALATAGGELYLRNRWVDHGWSVLTSIGAFVLLTHLWWVARARSPERKATALLVCALVFGLARLGRVALGFVFPVDPFGPNFEPFIFVSTLVRLGGTASLIAVYVLAWRALRR